MATITKLRDGWRVETWWDRRSRNWITQLKDENGYQVGHAGFSGNKDGAELEHDHMVNEAERIRKEES